MSELNIYKSSGMESQSKLSVEEANFTVFMIYKKKKL